MNLKRLLVLPQHIGVLAEQADVLQQQVAEIGGVEDLQPLLIARVELAALAVGEDGGFARRHLRGVRPRFFQPSIRPASMRAGQRFSSMFSACSSCFSSRTWSSTSRMVKLD